MAMRCGTWDQFLTIPRRPPLQPSKASLDSVEAANERVSE